MKLLLILLSDLRSNKRLPLLLLLAAIVCVTSLDWLFDLERWMLRPTEVVAAGDSLRAGNVTGSVFEELFTLISYAFLHADLSHLFGNAVFIWIFGAAVFDICGWRWVIAVFLITAVGGGLGHTFHDAQSFIPLLGASGGLMGLEGFYFGMAMQRSLPMAEVWPLAGPVEPARLAIFAAIGIGLDVAGVIGPDTGIAYTAHIGGFMTGMGLSFINRT